MTNPISQAAIDAGAQAIFQEPGFDRVTAEVLGENRLARVALEAAIPHIRKPIVADIENLGYNRAQTLELLRLGFSVDFVNGYERAVTDAARIAGGLSK